MIMAECAECRILNFLEISSAKSDLELTSHPEGKCEKRYFNRLTSV